MTNSLYALEKIKNVYSLKYDKAKATFAHLEKECLNSQKQLDDIMSYYNDYCKELNLKANNGLNINQLKNHHGFLEQFTPVISHQKNIIKNIQHNIMIEKERLIKCYKDLKAIEYILEEKNKAISQEIAKKETLAQEEIFVNVRINNKYL